MCCRLLSWFAALGSSGSRERPLAAPPTVTAAALPKTKPTDHKAVLEVVADIVGRAGHVDGELHEAVLFSPMDGVCVGDSVIVADYGSHTIRAVSLSAGSTGSRDTARTAAQIAAVAPVLPKELIAIIVDYARPIGVRTIAGTPKGEGFADGHALREAQSHWPSGLALDESDPVAGPQLIISDSAKGLIRCLNLRTEHVTTIAGDSKVSGCGHSDGPAHEALFHAHRTGSRAVRRHLCR